MLWDTHDIYGESATTGKSLLWLDIEDMISAVGVYARRKRALVDFLGGDCHLLAILWDRDGNEGVSCWLC